MPLRRATPWSRNWAKPPSPQHFCAVSTAPKEVAAFGIDEERRFLFWDWVGGRYSIWSSIGLSLAIGIGAAQFEDFLRGGAAIDQHFVTAPLTENVPVLMALIGIWYRNFWDYAGARRDPL